MILHDKFSICELGEQRWTVLVPKMVCHGFQNPWLWRKNNLIFFCQDCSPYWVGQWYRFCPCFFPAAVPPYSCNSVAHTNLVVARLAGKNRSLCATELHFWVCISCVCMQRRHADALVMEKEAAGGPCSAIRPTQWQPPPHHCNVWAEPNHSSKFSNHVSKSLKCTNFYLLSVWGGQQYFFSFSFHFLCLIWHVIEGMGESFLLSEDEPLSTPNIDGVMALWIFRGAQNTKIGKNWTSRS